MNGDGFDDIIVGAHHFSGGGPTDQREGKVYVYYGSPSGLSTVAAWSAEGNKQSAWFGHAVASAGDVDSDGYDDIIVGAPLYNNGHVQEGRAFVYFGSAFGIADTPWTAESNVAFAQMGYAVGSTGDVNGDGYSDVIVGAPRLFNGQGNEGRAYVFQGGPSGLTQIWDVEGNQIDALMGHAVATAGDINGDGYADVMVGAVGYNNGETREGLVYVYFGSEAGLSLTPAWSAESNQVGAGFGTSVGTAGDVNGDGYGDIAVGASAWDDPGGGQTDEGRAYVYLGSADGLATSPGWIAEGNSSGVLFGQSLAYAGDVNGDGYTDVVVGAPRFDNGQQDEGAAFVYLGSASGLSATPSWTAESDQPFAEFGYSVGSAGDVNGDGNDDVVVGARLFDSGEANEGRAHVYLGSASGPNAFFAWVGEGDQAEAQFGWSVSSAGDVNGDGFGDILVAAPYFDNGQLDEGRVYLYLGSSSGLERRPAWTAEGDQDVGVFGAAISTAGDVNGDGFSDVVIGSPNFDGGEADEGKAFLYLGSPSALAPVPSWAAESDQIEASFGSAVASAGDVNGDGRDDVLVGAYRHDGFSIDEGQAYLYLGTAGGLSLAPSWTTTGAQSGAYFATSLAGGGDVNNDGYSDVLVGAPHHDNGEINEGRAYLYLGSASGLGVAPAWMAEGNQPGIQFGLSVALAGDVTGDGFADALVGAPRFDNPDVDEGSVSLFYGNGSAGLDRRPRQARLDGTAIALLGRSDSPTSFQLRALGRTPAGRGSVRMIYEVKPISQPFLGTVTQQSPLVDTGAPGASGSVFDEFVELASGLADGNYKWRVRLASPHPRFPRSPWVSLAGNAFTAQDLRLGSCTAVIWHRDLDGDAHGDPLVTLTLCAPPVGYVADNNDCDDLDAAKFPGNPEICDGKDNDCIAGTPPQEIDGDGDAVLICAGDCDDSDPFVYPNAPEINNGRDDQCASGPGAATGPGYGVVDEVSGQAGFMDPGDPTAFCWPAQSGATTYQVARSERPDSAVGCATFTTSGTCITDAAQPSVGTAFIYFVRSITPFVGSWGQDSSGAEREMLCGAEAACDNGADDDVDSQTDCADADCFGSSGCVTETSCADGQDNDGDGVTDCDDTECSSQPAICPVVACTVLVCPGGAQCDAQLGPAEMHGASALLGYDINTGTGNLHLSSTDIVISPALSPDLRFERHYNSQGTHRDVGLGKGWTHSYSWQVSMPNPMTVKLLTGAGRTITFTSPIGGPPWIPQVGEFGTLIGTATTGFIYTNKFGTSFTMDTIANAGRLLAIRPAGRNPIQVGYISGTQISGVSSGDRTLEFRYSGNHISAVLETMTVDTWTYSVSETLDSVEFPNTDSQGNHGGVAYSYDGYVINGAAFSAGSGSAQLTRITVQQSPGVAVDQGLFSYSGTKVVRAASSAAGAGFQRDVSVVYQLCSDAASTTTATLNDGAKTITLQPVAGYQRITDVAATAGAGYDGVEWTSAHFTWNVAGLITSVTDGNGVVKIYGGYDGKGNPTSIIEGAGGPLERQTAIAYHPTLSTPVSIGRLSVDGASQHTVIYDYDSDYDTNPNADATAFLHQIIETGRTDTGMTGAADTEQTYTSRLYYDNQDRVIQIQIPNGTSRWFSYHASSPGSVIGDRLLSAWVEPSPGATLMTQVTDYDPYGRPLEIIDPNNVVTQVLSYNPFGRPRQTRISDGITSVSDRYEYNLAGDLASYIGPAGTELHLDYDEASRVWRRRAESGGSTPVVVWSEVSDFDDQNRVVAFRRFSGLGVAASPTCSPTGQEEVCVERSYDTFGRLSGVRTLGSDDLPCTGGACTVVHTYDANGSIAASTVAGVRTTSYERDARNRVSKITYPFGGYTTLAFDINDNIVTRRDPRDASNGGTGGDRAAAYAYDDFGRLLSFDLPDGGPSVYNYDAAGLRTAFRDAAGNLITYTYDLANRPTAMLPPTPTDHVTYTYDESGTLGGVPYAFTAGRLTTVATQDSQGAPLVSHYSYDFAGRIVDNVEVRGPDGAETTSRIHYDWSPEGSLLGLTYPSGRTVSYAYPTQGHAPGPKPDAVTADYQGTSRTIASDLAYFSDGVIRGFAYGNGHTYRLFRNKRRELTRIVSGPSADAVSALAHDSPAGMIVDQLATYDSLGLGYVTAMEHFSSPDECRAVSSFVEAFNYDPLTNSLASYSKDTYFDYDEWNWTWDEVANPTSESHNGTITEFQYVDDGNNQLTTVTGAVVEARTYDEIGRLETRTTPTDATVYVYDDRGLLQSIWENGGGKVFYTYDALFRLASRREPETGNETNYFYDVNGRPVAIRMFEGEYSNGDKVYTDIDFIYVEEKEVARVETRCERPCIGCTYICPDVDIVWIHEDFRGDSSFYSNELLAVLLQQLHGPFGSFDYGMLPGPDCRPGTPDDLASNFPNDSGAGNGYSDKHGLWGMRHPSMLYTSESKLATALGPLRGLAAQLGLGAGSDLGRLDGKSYGRQGVMDQLSRLGGVGSDESAELPTMSPTIRGSGSYGVGTIPTDSPTGNAAVTVLLVLKMVNDEIAEPLCRASTGKSCIENIMDWWEEEDPPKEDPPKKDPPKGSWIPAEPDEICINGEGGNCPPDEDKKEDKKKLCTDSYEDCGSEYIPVTTEADIAKFFRERKTGMGPRTQPSGEGGNLAPNLKRLIFKHGEECDWGDLCFQAPEPAGFPNLNCLAGGCPGGE